MDCQGTMLPNASPKHEVMPYQGLFVTYDPLRLH